MKYRNDTAKEDIETNSIKLNKKKKSYITKEKDKVANDGGCLAIMWKNGVERDGTVKNMEQSHGMSNWLQAETALKSVSKEAKTLPEMEETVKNEDHLSPWFPCVNETNLEPEDMNNRYNISQGLNTTEFFGQYKPSSM